eukprot:287659_1
MSYLARGYGVVRFHPERLNRGLKMDEFYFKNIKEICVEYPKSHKNMRWFAHYHLPVIRYWNPDLKLSVQHHKSIDIEPKIVMKFNDESERNDVNHDINGNQQILKAYDFVHVSYFNN